MITGVYRIVHMDANHNVVAELLQKHTDEFGNTTTLYQTNAELLPKVKKYLSTILVDDDILMVQVRPDVTRVTQVTPAGEGRRIRIPVTFRNVRTDVVYEMTLAPEDMVYVRGPVNVAGVRFDAGVWSNLCFYRVPAQTEMKFGHDLQDVRVDSAMNIWDTVDIA